MMKTLNADKDNGDIDENYHDGDDHDQHHGIVAPKMAVI